MDIMITIIWLLSGIVGLEIARYYIDGMHLWSSPTTIGNIIFGMITITFGPIFLFVILAMIFCGHIGNILNTKVW